MARFNQEIDTADGGTVRIGWYGDREFILAVEDGNGNHAGVCLDTPWELKKLLDDFIEYAMEYGGSA